MTTTAAPSKNGREPVPEDTWGQKRLLRASGIHDLPKPTWLIPDRVPEAATVAQYGAPGVYKSFYALDIALEVAQTRPVLYVLGENANEYSVRQTALEAYHRYQTDKLYYWMEPVRFLNDTYVARFRTFLRESELAPALIVFDTYSKCLAGDGDENSTQDAQKAVAFCDRLRREFNTTVWVVHHMGWGGDHLRGSSVLLADMDMVVEQARTEAGFTLRYKKVKGPPIDPQRYRLHPVAGTGSVIFLPDGTAAETPPLTFEQRCCNALALLAGVDGWVSGHSLGGALGISPKTVSNTIRDKGMKEQPGALVESNNAHGYRLTPFGWELSRVVPSVPGNTQANEEKGRE